MKFIITSGGTAGHINPSLALAEELVSRGHEVIFAGTPNRLESRLVPEAGYDFKSFEAAGFNRKKPLTFFKALSSINKSTKKAKEWLKVEKPNAVIGFGSYVSIAVCRAAYKLGIPYIIHEQNSVVGLANNWLSKKARRVCLTYGKTINLKSTNCEVTGNPVRRSIFNASSAEGRKLLGIPDNAKVLLIFGGSLGAAHINKSIIKMASDLLDRKSLYIVHITGESNFEEVQESLSLDADKKKRYIVLPYQDKMAETLAASDMCISRAGASTIAELTARALPALLIPYPYATENHQFHNAKALVDAGCVMLLNDSSVSTPEFSKAVIKLVDNDEMREDMHDAYMKFDASTAAKRLADIAEESV